MERHVQEGGPASSNERNLLSKTKKARQAASGRSKRIHESQEVQRQSQRHVVIDLLC